MFFIQRYFSDRNISLITVIGIFSEEISIAVKVLYLLRRYNVSASKFISLAHLSIHSIHLTKSGILCVLTILSLPGNHLLHKPVPRQYIKENMREVTGTFVGVRLL